jgi:hypothetical protein
MYIYDPSIKSLLRATETDWGDPEQNREMLVPYGIKPFDDALYGIDIQNGELILIQGPEKQRKTTMAINVIINYMILPIPKVKPVTVVDSLESGMHPARYRDQMIANVASRWLISKGHMAGGRCPECGEDSCKQLILSPEFLRYKTRTRDQKAAIEWAMSQMMQWPLYIFGASHYQGGARDLAVSIRGTERPIPDAWHVKYLQENQFQLKSGLELKDLIRLSRWEFMIKEFGAKIFSADHVQQYQFAGEPTDYEKQIRAVSAIGDLVARERIATLLLSQISLTSQRAVISGEGKWTASGGAKAAQEANVIFSVSYSPGSGHMTMAIEDSRKSSTFAVKQRLEDASGAFFGEPTRHTKGD